MDVDDPVLGHPRAPVLATPWVPVDAMECGDENALLVHDLAQTPPADIHGNRTTELHNDVRLAMSRGLCGRGCSRGGHLGS